MNRVLVIDDNEDLLTVLEVALSKRGFEVDVAQSGAVGIKKVRDKFYHVVVTDLVMPDVGGLDILKSVKEISPMTMVILFTGFATVQTATDALKSGAFDYVIKPCPADKLKIKIDEAIQKQRQLYGRELDKDKGIGRFGTIVGSSKRMRDLYLDIEKVAMEAGPVLLTGEIGSGKEMVAKEIHNHGKFAGTGQFVLKNALSLGADGFDAEHLHGDGTLLVKNVDELSEENQKGLLQYLLVAEEGHAPHLRVIVSTVKDLQKLVNGGKFREDLYFQLKKFSVVVPPLRARQKDISELVNHFVARYNSKFGKEIGVSPEVLALLKVYAWPGNVRELESAILQALSLAEGQFLNASDLPAEIQGEAINVIGGVAASADVHSKVGAMESELIRNALDEFSWNQSRAAKKLGLNRSSLRYKMKKYGLKED